VKVMSFQRFVLACGLSIFLASCASKKKDASEGASQEIKVREPSPVDPAAPPKVTLSGIQENAVIPVEGPLTVKVSAENYPLGADWQGIEVSLNDEPPVRVFESGREVLFKEGLRKGPNVVRAYLVRSWGESLKEPGAFATLHFYGGQKAGLPLVAKGRPVLTLVSPRGAYKGAAAKQVLFDFLVWDGAAAQPPKSYKVHYTLNGKKLELSSGKAYHFHNLSPGDYELLVEVVNSKGLPYGQEVTRARSRFNIDP